MSTKRHLAPDGQLKRCVAQNQCGYGEDAPHFKNANEANKAKESALADIYSALDSKKFETTLDTKSPESVKAHAVESAVKQFSPKGLEEFEQKVRANGGFTLEHLGDYSKIRSNNAVYNMYIDRLMFVKVNYPNEQYPYAKASELLDKERESMWSRMSKGQYDLNDFEKWAALESFGNTNGASLNK